MMNLIDALAPYIDPETGLIASKDGGKDNETLNVATFEHIHGELPTGLEVALILFMQKTKVKDGLWLRYLGATDNSVDNYIAVACLSPLFALQILKYGERNLWCFNPAVPDSFVLRCWYGRFLGFKPFIKARVYERMNTLDAFLFGASAVFTAFSEYGNTTDKCLQVLMNQYARNCHWLSDLFISLFERLMYRKYPKGLTELYGIYFGLDHPFTQAAGFRF